MADNSEIIGSANSRYFVMRAGNQVSLYRVPALLWTRNIPGIDRLIQVTNRGDVYLRVRDNFFRIGCLRESEMLPVDWVTMLVGSKRNAKVDKIRFNSDGTNMLAELWSADYAVASSFLSFFKKIETPSERTVCELMAMGENFGQIYSLPRRGLAESKKQNLQWAISPDFLYLATAMRRVGGGGSFELYRIGKERCLADFQVQIGDIDKVTVYDFGRMVIQVTLGLGQRCIVIRDNSGKSYTVELPRGMALLHVWNKYICWVNDEELVIADFEGHTVRKAALEPLKELGINFRFLFNKHNEIDLITYNESELFLTRVDPENLHIDAKRWEYVAQLKKNFEKERSERAQLEANKDEDDKQERERLSKELASSLNSLRREHVSQESMTAINAVQPTSEWESLPMAAASRMKFSGTPRPVAQVIKDIKANRLHFFAGVIEREKYLDSLEILNQELELSQDIYGLGEDESAALG